MGAGNAFAICSPSERLFHTEIDMCCRLEFVILRLDAYYVVTFGCHFILFCHCCPGADAPREHSPLSFRRRVLQILKYSEGMSMSSATKPSAVQQRSVSVGRGCAEQAIYLQWQRVWEAQTSLNAARYAIAHSEHGSGAVDAIGLHCNCFVLSLPLFCW